MQTATMEEIQARLPEILDQLCSGDEVLITRKGIPVAKLGRTEIVKPKPIFGSGKGLLIIHSEDDEHLRDFEEYMP